MHKDWKDLIAALTAQGAKVIINKHVKVYPSDKDQPMVVFGATSSDNRALTKAKARLRKSGFDV